MGHHKGFIPLHFQRIPPEEQWMRLNQYVRMMEKRRSVRSFSKRPLSEKVLEKVVHIAGTAPSGANQQPWTYILIKDPLIKRQIRLAAEQEESQRLQNYKTNGEQKLSTLGSHQYLEDAPYLVALFQINYGLTETNGRMQKIRHYYVRESAPISAGFFLAALQHAGIDCLIRPPVSSLQKILNRPKNESPLLLFAVGYAKDNYEAPLLSRKSFSELVIGETSFIPDSQTKAPPYTRSEIRTIQEQLAKTESYYQFIRKRRNVRHYSQEKVDEKLIYQALRAAITTPSSGNLQPYRFVVVNDQAKKEKIRALAEVEETKLYEERISDEWRKALAPLGTNASKPHLTDASHLIVAFKVDINSTQAEVVDTSLLQTNQDLSLISTAMAVGVLLGALHHAGLCTLTYTPSPMTFLRNYFNRPKNEMPILVLPVGYPAPNCHVPNITKKDLSEILIKL
ncbi:nitroreductase family protein [Thermoflavimicrobium daqui]|uniref:Nitroreductase domain-containing protein n=1 Tax=Thermoflavimicrobium daqui TaxID=2137476 RepID=A0A364K3U8_9BACL|nr:nitroreductase family protein [Thermoflavimicrobium daqui]RAL24043.1 hypothetical protein DL897_10095 [Thermoflavimicrobium daqui]